MKNVAMQPVSPPQQPPASEPEVCLRWNSHQTNMQATFTNLLSNEQFVDVTLACEGRSIKCHKIILSACSSYFEELLSQNPCQHPIILMKDLKFWEVQALVEFMYKGEVNVGQDKLPSLLSAAEALQIKGLAGPISSEDQNSFLPTIPLNLDNQTDESKMSSCTSQGVRKRKSVVASLSNRVNQHQNNTMEKCNSYEPKQTSPPEPSTSTYNIQEETSYEPPSRRFKQTEAAELQMDEIKIEPIDVDTGPVDSFNAKEIDDGGGENIATLGFEDIVHTEECVSVSDHGKST